MIIVLILKHVSSQSIGDKSLNENTRGEYSMAKVLILANNDVGLYKFRKELLEELVRDFEVFVSVPNGDYLLRIKQLGCKLIETSINRRGTNPVTDLKLLIHYLKTIRNLRPDIVLTYTIKPNIYGGLACRIARVPYISNITGLGTAVENKGLIQKIVLQLYCIGLKSASCVFFQNKSNKEFLLRNNVVQSKIRLIPGSGVNIEQFKLEEYPPHSEKIRFLFIGRIMREKGIDELLRAVGEIKDLYPDTQFDVVGFSEEDYNEKLNELSSEGIIKYHGQQTDIIPFIRNSHATILPSYHEGTANVLLESASAGRPVLASRVAGCMETFDEGISGFGFEVRNVHSLVETIIKFIRLPYNQKREMGVYGRKKMIEEFDRNIVINAYLDEINKIMGRETNV